MNGDGNSGSKCHEEVPSAHAREFLRDSRTKEEDEWSGAGSKAEGLV